MKEIQVIKREDETYPFSLKNIYDPPICLYAIGDIDILKERIVAIVGCRECSDYGRHYSREIAKNLAKNGFVTISGMAKGIDREAHIGSILGEGKTIAVLGSGVDVIYPKENAKLYEKILQTGGLILSEYPPKTKPEKLHFPQRNRIISGIAEATVVVEAKQRSGSLITAEFALEQGKDVYALPGNISSLNSEGTNRLIQDGAQSIVNIQEWIFQLKMCQ